ncbi:hypothetical protein PHYBOEH_005921 [Phytophthora boehmeriae]|uniref:Uncharacterized protein n=1 Tax=Phytophthora boehmeriae TaxID=109152 RepID=A0A8T1WNR0_9STRA|nr:hypothetical protein PHYBOEH_005921 [Phytophthora boehmeriae]
METAGYYTGRSLNFVGCEELLRYSAIKSRFDKVVEEKIQSEDEYFNLLVSLSEYSFSAFNKDAIHYDDLNHISYDITKSDGTFNNLFHYDYENNINYEFIYSCLANPLVRNPVYDHYCSTHKQQ